jgi:CRISPR type IV-associated protein Csf1
VLTPTALSPTQWAWATLDRGDYPPPEPKRGPRYGPDPLCWLCGAPTHGVGWPRDLALPPTYTNHNSAKQPGSNTVCQPCVALGSKETWEAYVADHPEKGLKTGHAMSWRCYSHVFAEGLHECPTRARWREWLLEPPEPPFLFIVATSGQKHLIFRGKVGHSRDVYPVQFEEQSLFVERQTFARCLAAFEALYALGFSKDSILSGEYHHGQLLKVGLAAWRPLEAALAPWRRRPGYLQLAHFVAQRPEEPEEEPAGPDAPSETPTVRPTLRLVQGGLFDP